MSILIKKNIISDILKWIEININNDIRIDDVANISGYSRRNIQLIFKKYTEFPLGTYIRQRKLCRSAALLKLTNLSIINIATQVGFSTQSSFNREFKKLFHETPYEYRKKTTWDLRKFRSEITIDDNNELIPSFRYLTDNRIFGYHVNFRETVTSVINNVNNIDFRFNLIKKNMSIYNKNLFIFSNFKPSEFNHNMLDIDCFVAFEEATLENLDVYHNSNQYYYFIGGLYVKFSYNGNWVDLKNYSKKIYTELFPIYGLSRRPGDDIEMFYYNDTMLENARDAIIECDYYIPISY